MEKKQDVLSDWTKDPQTKHFSGTGRYELEFNVPEEYISKNKKLELDLGKVGNIAKVELNGVEAGTIWMRGQKLDITGIVNAGKNNLVVFVTNTLINRISALEKPIPVPEELVSRFGTSTTSYSNRLPREFGFKPLPASGLMGPVKMNVLKKMSIKVN